MLLCAALSVKVLSISFIYISFLFSFHQVHRAVLKDGSDVVMKIQYPGVADSIESDIENVRLLLTYTNLIPKGLFLDRAMKVNIFFLHYFDEIWIIHPVLFFSCLISACCHSTHLCLSVFVLSSVKIIIVVQT
jgi:hypothetical protein